MNYIYCIDYHNNINYLSYLSIEPNHSIRITLKKEYLEKIDSDINEGIVKFGLMDDGYWKLIRRNALKYWMEWDRNIIFDVVEMNH